MKPDHREDATLSDVSTEMGVRPAVAEVRAPVTCPNEGVPNSRPEPDVDLKDDVGCIPYLLGLGETAGLESLTSVRRWMTVSDAASFNAE